MESERDSRGGDDGWVRVRWGRKTKAKREETRREKPTLLLRVPPRLQLLLVRLHHLLLLSGVNSDMLLWGKVRGEEMSIKASTKARKEEERRDGPCTPSKTRLKDKDTESTSIKE